METSVACAPLCPPAVKLQVKKTFLLRYIGGKLQNPSHGIEIIGFIFSGRKCQINPLKKHSGSEEPTALSKSHPECGRGEARGGLHPQVHHQVTLHHQVDIKVMWRMLEKQPGSRLGLLSQATKPSQVGVEHPLFRIPGRCFLF